MNIDRRKFFKTGTLGAGGLLTASTFAWSNDQKKAQSDYRIKSIKYYEVPDPSPTIGRSKSIVTVETNNGLTGIGEGGSQPTVKQCAQLLIGEDPFRSEHLWQVMYRGLFYPPGREKLTALAAIDMALWDIKGKALDVPVYQLLGGLTRDYIECYSTAFPYDGSLREKATACMEAGFRAYRISVAGQDPFVASEMVDQTIKNCEAVREGVGDDGDWAIDYHTRLNFPQAVRLSREIQDLAPYFCEDLIRSENPDMYHQLRDQVQVPIALGEQFGDRWDVNELIENHLMDYSRVSLPNAGGITEFMKIAAIASTHYVGLTPHFTGPVSTAALVHCCGAYSGNVMMEILGDQPDSFSYLPEYISFENGKLYPNERPGLGVEFDPGAVTLADEITEKAEPVPQYRRPDGSYTNW